MSNFSTLVPLVQGVPGTAPRVYSASTPDSSGDILAVGYLNDLGEKIKENDYFFINYDDDSEQPPGEDATFGQFVAVYSAPNMSLQAAAAPPGGALLAANNLSDVANAATSRTNLGLGTMAVQAASAVAITGGTVVGITDLAIADGGTGASSAAAALTALGAQATISIKAANTAASAGGSPTEVFTATGLTAASIVVPQIHTQGVTATSVIRSFSPGSNTLSVTFDSDPGANLVVSYIALAAAQ